jgi:hypothetical protein
VFKPNDVVGVWNRWFKDYTMAAVIEVKGKTLYVQYLRWPCREEYIDFTCCQSIPMEGVILYENREKELEARKHPQFERLRPTFTDY